MKKQIILMLVGLLLPATMMASQGQTLVLHHANGKTTEIELYTLPHIQMKADKMLITSQGVTQEFAKSDVVRFTYKGIVTGINNVKPETRYRVDEDRVTFYGISVTDRISVYNAGGVQIPVSLTADGKDAVLSLNQLPSGVYLVNINGRTLKFIRP
jgi:hypothetical protein